MEINLKDKQKEILSEHYDKVIEKINAFHSEGRGFILKDLLEEETNNHYYIYLTKGIILNLMGLEYVKIISCYNGYKNFVYLPLKEIK